MGSLARYSPYRSREGGGGGLLGRSHRDGCVLGIEVALAGCEGSHLVERIWFHSCEYSQNSHAHNISRDVAGYAPARRVAGVVTSQ